MKNLYRTLLAVAIFGTLLSGCATLNIDVDLYAGPRPGATRFEAQRAATAVLSSSEFNSTTRATSDTEARAALRDVFVPAQVEKLMRNRPADQPEAAFRARVQAEESQRWVTEYKPQLETEQASLTALRADVVRAAQTLRDAINSNASYTSEYLALVSSHDLYVDQRVQAWDRIYRSLCNGTNACPRADEIQRLAAAAFGADPASLTRRLAASAATNGRIVGYPTFDPLMEQLSEDRAHWKNFYTGRFKGIGGSARFVVVRQGLVVFDQKSLDFDPTPAIGAATALAKVGLQIAAAKALGRASFTTPGATGGATPTTSDTLIVNEAKLRAQQAALAERSEARAQALTLLAAQLRRIEAGPALDAAGLARERNDLLSTLHQYEGRLAATEVAP